MAAATVILAHSPDGFTATLNFNTTTLTALSVALDNTLGSVAHFFSITGTTTQSATVQPGQSQTITFPSALTITLTDLVAKNAGETGVKFTLSVSFTVT